MKKDDNKKKNFTSTSDLEQDFITKLKDKMIGEKFQKFTTSTNFSNATNKAKQKLMEQKALGISSLKNDKKNNDKNKELNIG